MEITHYGKINLSLHITNRRPDGYHTLDTLMQEVDVWDHLVMQRAGTSELRCNMSDVPEDSSNLVLRAHALLDSRYGIGPVRFELEKSIPAGAGMGGGSANAAAALKGLNELFGLGLSKKELERLGVQLGADVPFFFTGGTCRAQGIGEVLTPLPAYRTPLLLINDGTHADTRRVYESGPERTASSIDQLIPELLKGETKLTVANDLQKAAFVLYPGLQKTYDEIRETLPDTVQLSGTGATIYAIYTNIQKAEEACSVLTKEGRTVLLTKTRGEDFIG